MESLLLFRRALTSPTMCRFIPALSVPELPGCRHRPVTGLPCHRVAVARVAFARPVKAGRGKSETNGNDPNRKASAVLITGTISLGAMSVCSGLVRRPGLVLSPISPGLVRITNTWTIPV